MMALALAAELVQWSASARGYTGLLLFSLLGTDAYLRLLRRPDRTTARKYVVYGVLAAWFHLYAVWVIAMHVLHVIVSAIGTRRGRNDLSAPSFRCIWRSFAVMAGLGLLVYLPVLPHLALSLAAREAGFVPGRIPDGGTDRLRRI